MSLLSRTRATTQRQSLIFLYSCLLNLVVLASPSGSCNRSSLVSSSAKFQDRKNERRTGQARSANKHSPRQAAERNQRRAAGTEANCKHHPACKRARPPHTSLPPSFHQSSSFLLVFSAQPLLAAATASSTVFCAAATTVSACATVPFLALTSVSQRFLRAGNVASFSRFSD